MMTTAIANVKGTAIVIMKLGLVIRSSMQVSLSILPLKHCFGANSCPPYALAIILNEITVTIAARGAMNGLSNNVITTIFDIKT
jgi:hypothetical protein